MKQDYIARQSVIIDAPVATVKNWRTMLESLKQILERSEDHPAAQT